jgi:RecA/RadA recombinase
MSFLKEIIKEVGNEYAGLVSDGVEAGDVESFIDTGSYAFNALLSGSIYGGLASNKITAFAGESATGKTFFVLGIVKQFLEDNPTGGVLYFESESAITKQMIEQREIDTSRMVMLPVATIQEFAHQVTKVLDKHLASEDRMPLMICLDSLGMLSTSKEVGDITDGKETRDMTRAALVKGTFRVLTLKASKAKVPVLITNHTYSQIGVMFPQQIMGGGTGLYYASSNIVFLSKRKEKEGTEVIGNIIHCKNHKSRLTVENRMVDALVTYNKGLDRWHGMLELAEEAGIFTKVSTRFELPDGTKLFGKAIMQDPKKYFTEEIMLKIDKYCQEKFLYGTTETETSNEEVVQNGEKSSE